jgi:ArsR family transcriptional regulator, virulence genes transcriptional regulator
MHQQIRCSSEVSAEDAVTHSTTDTASFLAERSLPNGSGAFAEANTHEASALGPLSEDQVRAAATFFRLLSSAHRLRILCLLLEGEKSGSELLAALLMLQPRVSLELKRLREDQVIVSRRDGSFIVSSITDEKIIRMINILHEMFCRS